MRMRMRREGKKKEGALPYWIFTTESQASHNLHCKSVWGEKLSPLHTYINKGESRLSPLPHHSTQQPSPEKREPTPIHLNSKSAFTFPAQTKIQRERMGKFPSYHITENHPPPPIQIQTSATIPKNTNSFWDVPNRYISLRSTILNSYIHLSYTYT
jgi:hypothetical protein